MGAVLTAFLTTNTDPATIRRKIDVSSARIRRRLHRVGGWQTAVDNDPGLLDILEERTSPYWVIMKDTETAQFYGGPVRSYKRSLTPAGDERITLAGPDVSFLVEKRLALPDPAVRTYGTPGHATVDVQTGVASEVIRDYIDNNIGPSSLIERREPVSLTPSFLSIGGNVTGYASFDRLFTFCSNLAMQGGLVLDFAIGSSARADMTLRVPADSGMEWSERRNEIGPNWELERTAPKADYFYIQGANPIEVLLDGNGDPTGTGIIRPQDRVIASIGSAPPDEWGHQVETILDRPDITDAIPLQAEGYKEQPNHVGVRRINVGMLTAPDDYHFGVDFFLGDLGRVEVRNRTYPQMITGVDLVIDETGRTESVELGEPPVAGVSYDQLARTPPPAALGGPPPELGTAQFSSAAPTTVGVSATLDCQILATLPPGSVMTIERRLVGDLTWSDDPSSEDLTFPNAYGPATLGRNVTFDDAGDWEYRFGFTSTGGTSHSSPSQTITVNPPTSLPGQLTGTTATSISGTGFTSSWDRPVADAGVPEADKIQTRYRIQPATAWTERAPDTWNPAKIGSGYSSIASPGDVIDVQVRLVNDTGNGPWSATATVTITDPNATTDGGFTTSDGGYFLTADGGYFTTGT